ncbi:MAG: MtnX-like HAD-IB family phosphatase [Bacteroidota bacterium]|nr:MtnX-like HAD-IB family phosphatase [Bacteroidota bacterium]
MMARPGSYIVFTDFDGTMAQVDIGDTMFQQFGRRDECVALFNRYRNGEITARECWVNECNTVEFLQRETLENFAREKPLADGFHEFARYCEERIIPIHVLSDGFSAYIDVVLAREKLSHLPRYSNELQFLLDGHIAPLFPHTDAECTRCANCKRNHVLSLSGDDQVIVYVGDGYSDLCPARYADVVFAKNTLLKLCEKENITYHRFETFHDVLKKFREIVEKKNPHHRRTAALARKEIFMME